MNMVKDLLTREELRYIKRTLELLPEDAPVTFEIWSIGYNKDKVVADSNLLLRAFTELDEAVEYTKTITMRSIINADEDGVYDNPDINRIAVEVTTAIDDCESRTINLGTLYRKMIRLT